MPGERHSIAELEQILSSYCAQHQNAADTIDGVRTWWLGDPTCPLDELEAALGLLVRRGLLDVRRLPDGTAVYRSRPTGE